jgi:hypothetical protein
MDCVLEKRMNEGRQTFGLSLTAHACHASAYGEGGACSTNERRVHELNAKSLNDFAGSVNTRILQGR